MNYRKNFIIVMLVSIVSVCFGIKANALDIDNSNVDTNKTWKITFSDKISYDTAVKLIKVTDRNGEKVNARLELCNNGKTVKVKSPIREYVQGENYSLNIEKGIVSKNKDKKLKESKKVDFKVKCENPFKNMVNIQPGDSVKANGTKQYIFNKVQKIPKSKGKTLEENGWKVRVIQYNKLKDIRGLISSGDNAQSIELPFKLSGWLGVCVGYLNDTEKIRIKVKDKNIDNTYVNYNYKEGRKSKYINEAFVLASNFKDDILEICPIKGKVTNIAYIKLVSLSNDQIKAYNEKSTKRESQVVYDNDGFTDFFWGRYPTVESLERLPLNLVTKVDADELNWTVGTTGLLNYNSKYAGNAYEDFYKYQYDVREGDKLAKDQVLNIINTSRKSTLEVVANKAKQLGLRVNASLRMNTFYPEGYTEFLNGSMYNDYQDCRQNGGYMLSYYYPKYRNYILNILKEIASTPNVQGITLDFCRYPYIMGNEASLDEKIEIMNYFMKKVKKEIPNKKISVRFPYLDPKSYGLDIETWVKEGLVDRIIPSVISYEEFFDITKYKRMIKGTNVELYLGVSANVEGGDATLDSEKLDEDGKLPGSKYLTAEEYLYRAEEGYKSGVEGIVMFNTLNILDLEKNVSPMYKMIGDKMAVDRWYKLEYPSYLVNYKVDWII
ncbi:hypothetical protein IRP63_10090 [Clostridium botulinum]|uniref:SbsA Ig-like domain-containing protein n=1 Tax=Clostridium botulinum C/D str. DC5 TaxID=1443128 RepID=A0A0A0IIA0_CLOBO|nr:Ig-like domain-containing protein [Clostridium botulinum]KGM99986.1 hypothetical protein Z955_05265 [Clostridium botulinum C/D str. DC5]KOC56056.1 hypothetical protein ADU89_03985 [Clostridium botulinum]KOC57736.1 hypothetical protein ADU90_04350 [Clostridium botulinum]MCD3234683.1 hypothetical protein [Clostridium botulinum D/C]MCD3240520.1 hypothetical protein [Clostridium botulinum D/C]